jgi:hypothetical protein
VTDPSIQLPTWAAATLIVERALREWMRTDPACIPTERKVLERDEYRCQMPGCSRRHGLESHHVCWRSHGGSDRPENRILLCALHHRMVHMGIIRVTGTAPGNLRWEIGRPGKTGDVLRFLGERLVR